MVDEQKLRKLAMKAKGWKLDAFNQTADNAKQGLAYVGARDDEDDRFNDILEIDTGNYYQPEKAVEVAEFITTANPAAILSLLDELQTLREERTAWRVTAENAEAAVKQARIDALEEAAAICKANAAMCSEGVMRLTLEANAAAIESLKGTP